MEARLGQQAAMPPNSGGEALPLMPESTDFRDGFKLFFLRNQVFLISPSLALKPPCLTSAGAGQSSLCPWTKVAASGVRQK